MWEGMFVFATGVFLTCRFIWILRKCDKIKGRVIKGIFHYDKYDYEYKGKKRTEYAWVPLFNKKIGKECSIWVNKINHKKIYSKNEMLLWSSGFFFDLGTIFLFIKELLKYILYS